jgi:hypothetical protein
MQNLKKAQGLRGKKRKNRETVTAAGPFAEAGIGSVPERPSILLGGRTGRPEVDGACVRRIS